MVEQLREPLYLRPNAQAHAERIQGCHEAALWLHPADILQNPKLGKKLNIAFLYVWFLQSFGDNVLIFCFKA